MKIHSRCLPVLVVRAALHAQASGLESIRTNLEARVGGKWEVRTHEQWQMVSPTELPRDLQKGTYAVFVSDTHRTALASATGWMQICAAPFFILGTNEASVAITYVPRTHPVSQRLITALRLVEPVEVSPAEEMTRKKKNER